MSLSVPDSRGDYQTRAMDGAIKRTDDPFRKLLRSLAGQQLYRYDIVGASNVSFRACLVVRLGDAS